MGRTCNQRSPELFLDYELPPELIAQTPVEPRDASRLLVVDRKTGRLEDRIFSELPEILSAGDVVIINDSRVIPGRLICRRETGGLVEILLLERMGNQRWSALARPLGRLRPGEVLDVLDRDNQPAHVSLQFVERDGDLAIVSLADESIVARLGRMPLPPYIRETLGDAERYQTVYGNHPGSAAAPTAGLHFTRNLIDRCTSAGIEFHPLTLHVGIGTFRSLETDDPDEHVMHSEWFEVPASTAAAIAGARDAGRRIVSVGTTTTRVLETLGERGLGGDRMVGRTEKYIRPPYRFHTVDAMITNFHLPRTTLLLMVGALTGTELLRRVYEHAIQERYRFYSFGDAMLIV